MAVPGFQTFFRPILEVLSDGQPWAYADLVSSVANKVGLTEADRAELLPSGRQARYSNRIGWAKTYLAKSGLVETPVRGRVQITDRGREALRHAGELDAVYLQRFPEYVAFKEGTGNAGSDEDRDFAGTTERTPDELLLDLTSALNRNLADGLLELLREKEPGFFESVVVKLLVRMGYGGTVADAGQAIGRSGDGGIDGIIKQDRLGLDNVYVQAKRYSADRKVNAGEVRNLAGALQMRKATKGVLITTASFSHDALRTAQQIGNIVLIDGARLADLMIEFDLGVSTEATYHVKKVDQDFFDEWA